MKTGMTKEKKFHVFWIAFFSQITKCETEHVIPNRRLSLYKNTMDSKKFNLSTIIALKGENKLWGHKESKYYFLHE